MRVLVAVPAERDGAGVVVAAAVKVLGFVGWVEVRAVAQHPLLVLPLTSLAAVLPAHPHTTSYAGRTPHRP